MSYFFAKKYYKILGYLGNYSYIRHVINEIDMRLYLETIEKIKAEFGNFDISQVIGGSNDVYLRFGYWKRVDATKLQNIVGSGINVVEDDDYDDDCGYLFSYKLK